MPATADDNESDIATRVAEAAADTRALRQLTLLILGGLACTVFIVAFLVLAAVQAVAMIDEGGRTRETAQVTRYVNAVPGGLNEITLDAMATTLDLRGARLTQLNDVRSGELSVSLAEGSDRVVAWTPQLLGSATFAQVAPARIAAGVIFSMIVGIIGWRVVSVSNRLDRRRAAAARLAHTDTLTGVGNRRAFDRELRMRLAAARASGKGVGLVLIDLDGFKQINDQYGHAVGDHVLREVARRLHESCGPGDLVARLGGDEFAVVCDVQGLDQCAATLNRRVGDRIDCDGRVVVVGASIGTSRTGASTGDVERLVQEADVELYRVKRAKTRAATAIPMARLHRSDDEHSYRHAARRRS